MNIIDRSTVIHYHRHRIARFGGESAQALGWVSEDSQLRRFEAIANAADFNHASVIDLGCGTGDLKDFLDGHFTGVSYLGIEQVPEFVARAKARHAGDPSAQFELGDFSAMILPRVDHVVACGSLSYRSSNPHHVFGAIAKMFVSAAQTVVFSVLDSHLFPEHPLLVGHHVDEIVAFCQKLSPSVRVMRSQVAGDSTVMISVAASATTTAST